MNDLQIYRGDPLRINDHIIVRQPTLGEIADFGEERYFTTISALCGTPSDYMVALDDLGINFEDITEFQMFIMISKQLLQEDTRILLGDLSLADFEYQVNMNDNAERLFCPKTGVVIDRAIYSQITSFVRRLHWLKKNIDRGGNEHSRQYLIERKRRSMRYQRNKKFQSVLYPLISGLCNCEYTHFDVNTVWDMRVFAFYDSLNRVKKIQQARALTNGIYAGTINGKKIDEESLDWLGVLK